jgi:hypothetical protein
MTCRSQLRRKCIQLGHMCQQHTRSQNTLRLLCMLLQDMVDCLPRECVLRRLRVAAKELEVVSLQG